jgi:dihydroceramidase
MKFELKRDVSEIIGFWGPSTSSVDWCESNYEITEYMAEFNNTLSSLSLVLAGLLGLIMHPWSEKRFKVAFITTIICTSFY